MLTVILPSYKEPDIHRFAKSVEDTLNMPCQIIVSQDRYGRGKGWAIRQAMQFVAGDIVVFLDSDGDIQPRMLNRLIPFMSDFEAVVGTKRINHRHLSRRIVSLLSRIYIRVLFGLQVDTQTGIKIFRKAWMDEWETDGWLFDVEVLHNMKKRGARIIEVPVEVEITERMSGRALWRTLVESLTLRCRLSFRAR